MNSLADRIVTAVVNFFVNVPSDMSESELHNLTALVQKELDARPDLQTAVDEQTASDFKSDR